MKSITISIGKVKPKATQIVLADTVILRVRDVFLDRPTARKLDYAEDGENHFYKNFILNGATFSVDSRRNEWREFTDIKFSVTKYLFGGSNNRSFRRESDYRNKLSYEFMGLQYLLRRETGIEFSIYKTPLVRYDVAGLFDCASLAGAEYYRDYAYENVSIPFLTNKREHLNTRYFNNRSAYSVLQPGFGEQPEILKQPERAFVLYPSGRNCREESRYYTADSIRVLLNSQLGQKLGLENNLRCFLDAEVMSHIFWQDGIHLIPPPEREKVIKTYGLKI
jgi:hypothetical protein